MTTEAEYREIAPALCALYDNGRNALQAGADPGHLHTLAQDQGFIAAARAFADFFNDDMFTVGNSYSVGLPADEVSVDFIALPITQPLRDAVLARASPIMQEITRLSRADDSGGGAEHVFSTLHVALRRAADEAGMSWYVSNLPENYYKGYARGFAHSAVAYLGVNSIITAAMRGGYDPSARYRTSYGSAPSFLYITPRGKACTLPGEPRANELQGRPGVMIPHLNAYASLFDHSMTLEGGAALRLNALRPSYRSVALKKKIKAILRRCEKKSCAATDSVQVSP